MQNLCATIWNSTTVISLWEVLSINIMTVSSEGFFQVGILKGMCQNWAKSSWNGNSNRPGPYQFATLITSKNPGFTPNFRGFQCNNYASKEHTRFNRKMDGDLRKWNKGNEFLTLFFKMLQDSARFCDIIQYFVISFNILWYYSIFYNILQDYKQYPATCT